MECCPSASTCLTQRKNVVPVVTITTSRTISAWQLPSKQLLQHSQMKRNSTAQQAASILTLILLLELSSQVALDKRGLACTRGEAH